MKQLLTCSLLVVGTAAMGALPKPASPPAQTSVTINGKNHHHQVQRAFPARAHRHLRPVRPDRQGCHLPRLAGRR